MYTKHSQIYINVSNWLIRDEKVMRHFLKMQAGSYGGEFRKFCDFEFLPKIRRTGTHNPRTNFTSVSVRVLVVGSCLYVSCSYQTTVVAAVVLKMSYRYYVTCHVSRVQTSLSCAPALTVGNQPLERNVDIVFLFATDAVTADLTVLDSVQIHLLY